MLINKTIISINNILENIKKELQEKTFITPKSRNENDKFLYLNDALQVINNYIEYQRPIEELDIPVNVYHWLKKSGINTIEELRQLSDDQILKIRNITLEKLNIIKESLKTK